MRMDRATARPHSIALNRLEVGCSTAPMDPSSRAAGARQIVTTPKPKLKPLRGSGFTLGGRAIGVRHDCAMLHWGLSHADLAMTLAVIDRTSAGLASF